MSKRQQQPTAPPQSSTAVSWGPAKQDYPGGPIYKIGTSSGVTIGQGEIAEAAAPLEPVAEIVQATEYDGEGKPTHQRDIDYYQEDVDTLAVGTKLYAIPPGYALVKK